MINLLSLQYKNENKKEYFLRLGVVCVWFGLFANVVLAVSLLPSFLFITTEEKAIHEELASLVQNRDPKIEAISNTIQDINTKIHTFEGIESEKNSVQVYIEPILSIVRKDVSLTSIAFARSEESESSVRIRGTATSRISLLEYKGELEKTGKYEKIEVPISTFLKDNNVSFEFDLRFKKANEAQ